MQFVFCGLLTEIRFLNKIINSYKNDCLQEFIYSRRLISVIDYSKLNISKISSLTSLQLRAICKDIGLRDVAMLKKSELVALVEQNFSKIEAKASALNSSPSKAENVELKENFDGNAETFYNDYKNDKINSDGVFENANKSKNEVVIEINPVTDSVPTDDLPALEINVSQVTDDNNVEVKKQTCSTDKEPTQDSKNDSSYGKVYKNDKNKGQKFSKTTQNKKQQTEEIDLSECEVRSGILEISPDGFGFLRAKNFRNSEQDTYVSSQKIRKYGLRAGDLISAYTKSLNEFKPPALIEPITVNDKPAQEALNRPLFENFVPIYPKEKLRLEVDNKRNDLAVRAIDLIAPIGKGQRAMVVSPPKAGKTTLLKMIANSIAENNPEVKLMVLGVPKAR